MPTVGRAKANTEEFQQVPNGESGAGTSPQAVRRCWTVCGRGVRACLYSGKFRLVVGGVQHIGGAKRPPVVAVFVASNRQWLCCDVKRSIWRTDKWAGGGWTGERTDR